MKLAFKIMSIFWIVSPLIFIIMRTFGIVDYKLDWLIFAILAMISYVAMFLNFRKDND